MADLQQLRTDVPPDSDAVVGHPPDADEPGRLFQGKGLFWLPVLPLLALDLWSKAAAFEFLHGKHGRFVTTSSHEVFTTGLIDLDLVNWLNPGTIWGLFRDYHNPLKYLRLVAVVLIVWFAFKTPHRARFTLLALGFILAGALGNLYDNFFHRTQYLFSVAPGAVRDFLYFHNDSPAWDFPAFNVADACITVGAVTLFCALWGTTRPPAAPH